MNQKKITFILKDTIKNESTIMIDVVCAFDASLARHLDTLYPVGYFAHVDDLMNRYGEQIKIWRFVASKQNEVYKIILDDFPYEQYGKVFFFCAYPVQGRFCGKIDDMDRPVVLLREDKIVVENKRFVSVPKSQAIFLKPKTTNENLSFTYQLSKDFIPTETIKK